MNQSQAEKLLVKIGEEMPEVEATLQARKAGKSSTWLIHCFLPCAGLRLTASEVDDWPSIKDAWRWFLPGAENIIIEERRKVKYLVNGMLMSIYLRNSDNRWFGSCYINKKRYVQHFGLVDPRPSLQEVSV